LADCGIENGLAKESSGMTRTTRWLRILALIIFSANIFSKLYAAPAHKRTFTGEVGDAMCGRQHMDGTPAECTRGCVAHGSKYALVIDDKIYALETSDKTALAALDKHTGKNATVTGTLNGDIITVRSVAAK
jgi:hypothetical protein